MKTSISIKFYDDFLDIDAVLHAKHSLWVSLTRISDIDNYVPVTRNYFVGFQNSGNNWIHYNF